MSDLAPWLIANAAFLFAAPMSGLIGAILTGPLLASVQDQCYL